jgi:dUTP pyrophosphatase
MKLKIKRITNTAKIPTRAHLGDLGYDLYADETVLLERHEVKKISTGIAVEFPEGWGARICDRSSMASKGITTSAGIIDSSYTGEICVLLTFSNDCANDQTVYKIEAGDKIAQLLPTKVVDWEVEEVDEISENGRGTRGFGSSGSR